MDNNDAVFNVQELPFEDDILPDSSYIEEPVDDQMMDPFDQCSVCSDITDFLKLNGANRVGRHHELGVLCPWLQL